MSDSWIGRFELKHFWGEGSDIESMSGPVKRLRREAREASDREAVLEGLRARRFTPQETLRQGCGLIDFALKVQKERDGES